MMGMYKEDNEAMFEMKKDSNGSIRALARRGE
jgi:hypothetical protein